MRYSVLNETQALLLAGNVWSKPAPFGLRVSETGITGLRVARQNGRFIGYHQDFGPDEHQETKPKVSVAF